MPVKFEVNEKNAGDACLAINRLESAARTIAAFIPELAVRHKVLATPQVQLAGAMDVRRIEKGERPRELTPEQLQASSELQQYAAMMEAAVVQLVVAYDSFRDATFTKV